MLQMPYRELIGTLLWIANGTRPDIAYAVITLAKYTSNPGEIRWQALLRVLGYLQATLHHCICYTRNEEQENGIAVSGHARSILPTMSDFKCYVDASYAGDEEYITHLTSPLTPTLDLTHRHLITLTTALLLYSPSTSTIIAPLLLSPLLYHLTYVITHQHMPSVQLTFHSHINWFDLTNLNQCSFQARLPYNAPTCTRSGQPMHASCAQPEVSPPICTQCYAIPLDLTDI